jgi:hypothetical protein
MHYSFEQYCDNQEQDVLTGQKMVDCVTVMFITTVVTLGKWKQLSNDVKDRFNNYMKNYNGLIE